MCPRRGALLDPGLDPLDATGLGLGLALALAPPLEACDSVREQPVRAVTSAEMDRTKRTPGRIERRGAGDMIGWC